MFAKQTIGSASLVVVLGGAVLARAEPPSETPTGEAVPKKQPTGTMSVGGGFVTDDGFFARATIQQTNLFGTGDLLALDAMISGRRQMFDARFADPHFLDSDFKLQATLYSDRQILPGFTRAAVGGQLQFSHELADHITGFVGYRFEHVMPDANVDTIDHAIDPTQMSEGLHSYNLGSVRAGLAYSTLDRPMLPLRGSTLGASLEVADPRFGSDIQFTRVDAWAGTHQPLGPLTFHLTGRVSAIGSQDAEGVPMSERFFLDGSRDLPGFLPGALGPPIGGNLEALGRAELEVPLARSIGISVVGFYTAGAIYDWHGNGGVGQSVGVGLRWRSPIGPLELDFAIPLGGGPPALVFGLGASF
jgi:outer membrane protein insertion porin family